MVASSHAEPTYGLRFEAVTLDHPDVVRFDAVVQAFYLERYGDTDRTPMEPTEFAPPDGLFLLGWLADTAACCGGWRRRDEGAIAPEDRGVLRPGDAEIKRMFVEPGQRRRGLARALLAELEATARAAGCPRMVLETGVHQPEAVALYRRAGYESISGFGVYRDAVDSRCFARDLA